MTGNTIRRIAAISAALLISLTFRGQDADFITLYGHVSDIRTSESLYFSSINLYGTNISNIANSEGHFSLKIPKSAAPDANVLVSHLGYQTETVKVCSFYATTSENPLEIKLIPVSIHLDPATVRAIEPDVLIRSALHNVKYNYPTEHVGMTAFYREIIRKGTVKYLVLNEAVIDINKSPYTGFSSDRVGIYKGRGCTNYDTSDTLFIKYQGGIVTALELDQVKHPFAGIGPELLTDTYSFFMDGMATCDGHSFYKVGFRTKDHVDDILFTGSIYIEVESLAIGRVEMEMDIAGREEEAAGLFIVKRPQDTRFYINKVQYIISYKCFDGKWYYDYCRADLNFSSRRNNSMFRRNFSITEEMAITDHKDGEIAIEQANRVKFKDILSDKVADFTDDNFWEDYNIIEPDQSIEAIIKKIIRKLVRERR